MCRVWIQITQGRGILVDPAPLKGLSNSLRPWLYYNSPSVELWKPWTEVLELQQGFLLNPMLEGNGIYRILCTNYRMDENVNGINAAVPQHKWYWDAK